MSVPYLREALQFGDSEKLIRFVRLHLGDGNEDVGRKEIDKSWMEALKILLRYENPDLDFIEQTMQKDESTLRCSTSICTSISFANPRTGFTMAAANSGSSRTAEPAADPRETATQLPPGLWQTINERYPARCLVRAISSHWRDSPSV